MLISEGKIYELSSKNRESLIILYFLINMLERKGCGIMTIDFLFFMIFGLEERVILFHLLV